MSSCEKCWADAYLMRSGEPQAVTYGRLVKERNCTPEQQAGPDATECSKCKRRTRHQYTGECMACGDLGEEGRKP